jgi:hypothetical protein
MSTPTPHARDNGPQVNAEYWRPSQTCWVCGERTTGEATAYLCGDCKKVHGKDLTAAQKAARIKHMREQWRRNGEFRCQYTGVRLELDDRDHVRYREWDHAIPGNEDSIVLAAALVNRMKCYLTANEFPVMVAALARHFGDPAIPFDESAFPDRPVPRSNQV